MQMKKWFYAVFKKNKEVKTPKEIVTINFDWGSYFDGKELI